MRRAQRTRESWETVLAQLTDYPGTQAEFCEAHDITLSNLRYHLSRKKRSGASGGVVLAASFVAVGSVGEHRNLSGKAVEMSIGQIRLNVWADSDPAALRLALEVAVESCGRT